MRKWLALFALVSAVGPSALSETMPISLDYYGQSGKTAVFRTEVDEATLGTITGVVITDTNQQTGSSGVFSGFDLDFVFFDVDGDLATTDDRVYPLQNEMTHVTPGAFRKGAASPYQPTVKHPGQFFGLLADGSIDFATATLASRDATYLTGYYLSPDTSDGWVSLGDAGQISLAFPPLSAGPGGGMHLFVGDVGVHEELASASVELSLFVGATPAPMFDGAGTYYAYPGETISFDGVPPDTGDPIVSWLWDLNNDGTFGDASGPVIALPFEYFTETLGLPPGLHTILLQTTTQSGKVTTTQVELNLAPEPTTMLLLAAGAAGILLRRKRRE